MATTPTYATTASGSTASTPALATIDVNHPYYLHPSDNPGMTLTNVVLNEQNFLNGADL